MSQKTKITRVVILVMIAGSPSRADIFPVSYGMANRVEAIVGGLVIRSDSNWFGTENNLSLIQNNHVDQSLSNMSHSLSWTGDSAAYSFQGSQLVIHPEASVILARGSGAIDFVPSVETLASFSIQYSYSVPSVTAQALVYASITDDQNYNYGQIVFSYNPVLDPLRGTFSKALGVTLPQGHNYTFGFELRLFNVASDDAAIDSGVIELTLTPVPEPSAILPLALGAILQRRHRARR